MEKKYILFLTMFVLLASTTFGQITDKDTLHIYNEIKGDYAIYLKKHSMEVPFKIDIDNNILLFKKTGNKNDIELNPIDIVNLKFKLIYPGSKDYLTFYRDKNGEISSFDLVCGKKNISVINLSLNKIVFQLPIKFLRLMS